MTIRFDRTVAPGGYAWWYLDAWSDDGRQGLTLIAFVGSVFSPYYALARRRGEADPEHHCAVNVALYGAPGESVPTAWCMTERGARHVQRDAHQIAIGPSALRWDDGALTIELDEVAVPWPARLRGRIRVQAEDWHDTWYPLDDGGRHRWRPIAPRATVDVDLARPGAHWQGTGYLDTNEGSRPLADDFERWDWLRAPLPDGGAAIQYDVMQRGGREKRLALGFPRGAPATDLQVLPRHALPRTAWRLQRFAAADHASRPELVQTLEDGPFYARSRVRSQLDGQWFVAMHESLSLDRWQRPVVQAMLPFRMPRRS